MDSGLYLCATPIGNLEDITLRVLRVLRECDLIAAEDTRHTRGLLARYDIEKPLISYHEHNKYERAEELVKQMAEGKTVALVSDAGSPVISDPGEVLVVKCQEAGIRVTCLPGPCALICGLSLSGLPARRFSFEGFLPQSGKERREVLHSLREEERTIVLYEAPHRLVRTLRDLTDALGEERTVSICRELTKVHEEQVGMTLGEALSFYESREPRGEYVLVLAGLGKEERQNEKNNRWLEKSSAEHLADYLALGLTKKEAMKRMASDFGISKREVYSSLLNEPADEPDEK